LTKIKIKIIGDPGQHNVGLIKMWLENSLKKLNVFPTEVYLAFIKNIQQIEMIYRRFTKTFENLSFLESSIVKEMVFVQLRSTAYIPKQQRRKGKPPIILIKQDSRISENDLLDEVAHIKEEENGWDKIKVDALTLFAEDYGVTLETPTWLCFSLRLKAEIFDFFSSELMCQYGLANELFFEKQRILNIWIREFFPYKGESKIQDFNIIMIAAFHVTLPPSYPRKEDERKLKEMIINYVHSMSMEPLYQKIKSIVSKLESPPKVANIYKCSAEIIKLAQDFLEKQ